MNTADKHLNTAQAARVLGVTTMTIRRYVQGGKLRATITLGGHLRFTQADIDAALERCQLSAKSAIQRQRAA